jgi:sugar phosphate isomerase/epimerase
MIGISTSYCSHIFKEPHLIFEALINLGFRAFEIDYRWDKQMFNQLERIIKTKKIRINSLHNFCPIPEGIKLTQASPENYLLSSEDEKERELAIKFTKMTIENAARLGAEAVVLHCGKVFEKKHTNLLIKMYNSNERNSKTYKTKQEFFVSLRRRYSKKYFLNTLRSLEELDKFAKLKKVKLGIENRYYFGEIPQVEEIAQILNIFDAGSAIGYWHDVGHAQCLENLGFYKLENYLVFFDRLLGIHLHDIKGCCDHLSPFEGEFDFKKILSFVKKSTLKIMEAHQPASRKSLIEARVKLEKLIGGL